MTLLTAWTAQWLHAETISTLGFTLLHFVWEGLALAVALFVALAFFRNAQTRYALAVCTLAVMLIAPVLTFAILSQSLQPTAPALQNTSANTVASSTAADSGASQGSSSLTWPARGACLWIAGVLLFSIRTTGGWLVLTRLRRQYAQSLPAELISKFQAFERRLELRRPIRYLQSKVMDAPAVIGWFRPIVLVPLSAISGLSPEQLGAVIVHELAHIKRLDCFVNLFQIAAETLFFYNPAVWWVNRVIRNERENCCDDISVAICGNATEYARALTQLESARATPEWALSATGGVLKARIIRLLRPHGAAAAISSAGLIALGILCISGALLTAAVVTNTTWRPVHKEVALVTPAVAEEAAVPAPAPAQTAVPAPAPATEEIAQASPAPSAAPEPPTSPQPADGSYIDGLKAAGLNNLTIDNIIALKIQGVTPQYIDQIRKAGFTDLNAHELIALKVQNIDPEYIRLIRAEGLNPTLHEVVALKVQNVTPGYIRALKSAGLGDLRVHDYIAAKVQDVTPDFIEKVRSHGFNNVTLHQLIELKIAGIF